MWVFECFQILTPTWGKENMQYLEYQKYLSPCLNLTKLEKYLTQTFEGKKLSDGLGSPEIPPFLLYMLSLNYMLAGS